MPQLEHEPLTRCQILLYTADLDKLRLYFGERPGYGKVVRLIVRKWLIGINQQSDLEKEIEYAEQSDTGSEPSISR